MRFNISGSSLENSHLTDREEMEILKKKYTVRKQCENVILAEAIHKHIQW